MVLQVALQLSGVIPADTWLMSIKVGPNTLRVISQFCQPAETCCGMRKMECAFYNVMGSRWGLTVCAKVLK